LDHLVTCVCCAPTASGHAAGALPLIMAMNVRRLIAAAEAPALA